MTLDLNNGRCGEHHSVANQRKGAAMTTIHADELQPGDIVAYGGDRHVITAVERHEGWAWPIAADGTGWAIALGHQLIDVERLAA
jgi:hypothetical protein